VTSSRFQMSVSKKTSGAHHESKVRRMLACLVTPTTMIFFNDEMCTWYYSIDATVGWMRMTPAPVPPPMRQNTGTISALGPSPSFHKKHQSQVENSETLDFVFVFSKLILYPLSFILQIFLIPPQFILYPFALIL
jgi:hypothetical protein